MFDRKVLLTFYLTLIVYNQVSEAKNNWIEGARMKNVITDIAEKSLGASVFQDYIYHTHMRESPLNGQLLLNKFIEKFRQSLQGAYSAIQNIKEMVEKDYSANNYKQGLSRTDPRQCCLSPVEDLIWSNEFLRMVGPSRMCTRFSKDATDNPLIPFSEGLLNVMKNNRDKKYIKWQYYGTEDGVFVKYPQQKDKVCDAYDPRYRPWYAETAVRLPKDIVIVFQRSASIVKKELLVVIKNAVVTVIQTLNTNDRIGLVAFSDQVFRPPGVKDRTCYYNQLAFATSDNKDYLVTWVKDITGGNPSDYKVALSAAFTFFTESEEVRGDSRHRSKVLMFLGDGIQDFGAGNEAILDLISEHNSKLNNSVIIVTYGIGQDMSPEAEQLLQNMSMQTKANLSVGPVKRGEFFRIKTSTNLRANVGSYYSVLDDNYDENPVITPPYVDFSGLGIVISICLPVRLHDQLKGVTCLDMSLTEMTESLLSLHHGRDSYAFISDYKGKTVLHPLMPDALNYGSLASLDIKDLETQAGVREILEMMMRTNSGSKTLMKEFVRPRGNTTTDGVRSETMEADYFWAPIDNNSFSLAIVTTDSDKNISLSNTSLASKRFVYHRLDLVDDVKKCSAHGRLSTHENSVVKLTEAAFVKRFYYIVPDTKELVDIYTAYMESKQLEKHDRIKLRTKQMIAISEHLEEMWMTRNELDDFVIWRYYGDYYGHIRIYPGISLPREYDHTQRGFFWKTVNNPEGITLTPPYLDAFGAGVVSSIVIPVFAQRKSPVILGVLGLDIKTNYIKYLVEETFSACKAEENSCFIMDSSGYLVYHSDSVYKTTSNTQDVYSYHITELETEISLYLISGGYLTASVCIEFGHKKRLHTWKMTLESSINTYDTNPYFDLVKIIGTNLFIGIKKKRNADRNDCACANRTASDYGATLYKCTDKPCTCPCFEEADYNYCQNQYFLEYDQILACIPQPRSIGFKSPIPNEAHLVSTLPNCYQYDCNVMTSEGKCKLLEPCIWCSDTSQCVRDTCPPKKVNVTVITAIIGAIVLFIIIFVAVFVARKRGACERGTSPKPGDLKPDIEYRSSVGESYVRSASRFRSPGVIQEGSANASNTDFEDIRIVGRDVEIPGNK